MLKVFSWPNLWRSPIISALCSKRWPANSPWAAINHSAWRLLLLLALASPLTAGGEENDDFSLEDLMQVEMTSGNKFSQELSDIPAAAYILSRQDIMLSGATNLPELLQNIPGIFVASASANSWAIGSRGFAGVFANKLLVMVDGRSLFSPLFSGVFWDLLDIYINDIKRIEVIRGSGSSVWGANAINGIINIITEASVDTQGLDFYSHFGNQISHDLGMRYGTVLAEGVFGRAYIKQKKIDAFASESEQLDDGWQSSMTGLRLDGFSNRDSWYVSADYIDQQTSDISIILPSDTRQSNAMDNSSWNLSGSWQRLVTPDNRLSLAMHIQEQQRDGQSYQLKDKLFNVEFDHSYRALPPLLVNYGLGYRVNRFALDSEGDFTFIGDKDRARAEIYSGYGQLNYDFNQRQSLQIGTKVERHIHNGGTLKNGEGDFQGYRKTHWFPNIKYLHKLDQRSSFWLSLNKNERVPSVSEQVIDVALYKIPALSETNPSPWDIVTSFKSNLDFKAEKINSAEFGFRSALSPKLNLDIAVFYSEFDRLRSTRQGAALCRQTGLEPPYCNLPDTIEAPLLLGNYDSATSLGFETYSNYLVSNNFRLQLNYAYLDVDYDTAPQWIIQDSSSTVFYRHSLGLTGDWLTGEKLQVRAAYSYKSDLETRMPSADGIKSTVDELNISVFYQLFADTRLSLQLKNLLNDEEYQWFPEFPEGSVTREKQQFLLGLRMTF